jgi:sterol O-acyltransferase
MFIAEKALATLGTFTLIILIVEHYILPVSANVHETTFFVTVLDLAMPFTSEFISIDFEDETDEIGTVNYLLIFVGFYSPSG